MLQQPEAVIYDALYHLCFTLNELSKDAKYLGGADKEVYLHSSYLGLCNELSSSYLIPLFLEELGMMMKINGKKQVEIFFSFIQSSQKVFRGKYLDELESLWNDSLLKFHGTAEKYQNSYQTKRTY